MNKDTQEEDLAYLKALAELIQVQDIAELEIRRTYRDDSVLEVRLNRRGPLSPSPPTVPPAHPAPASTPHDKGESFAPAETVATSVERPGASERHPGLVTSPMVGTVYLQAEPGASPFIKVGDDVSEGQTLLIIEAMKTMNHIPSPFSGKVVRILAENQAPVEFGAPLVIIE
ncbi:MAG: acetyl-CoA carboxylase, biotin carboxyl carrier protein [Paracoccaceae bacterium]|nr:acetyl-CoA carboxylase, biotin carboxyl carrier protein [Paracoccaceae bacterium]MDE2915243.1 acetyl-CoA carboxylase, biotin carboxyl carrier protein [Paracoccaceae bacterium]